jgi:hypothetical protein
MSTDSPDVEAALQPSGAPPTVAELQAEVEAARNDLVASLAQLREETTPGSLVKRGGRAVTGVFTDEFGGIRPERVAIAGAVVVLFITWRVLRRRRG